jgi:hypothetical protein
VIESLPIPDLLNEWLRYANWVADPNCDKSLRDNFNGADEFYYVATNEPEKAWEAILACTKDIRLEPYFAYLSAGPLETFLLKYGDRFIDRIEMEARTNSKFAYLLGGVWLTGMPDDIASRVQTVWNRGDWDGNP